MVATPGGQYPRSGDGALCLSLVRLQLSELMQADVFTEEEQDWAIGNIYGCEDALRLQWWFRNVLRVKQERAKSKGGAGVGCGAEVNQKVVSPPHANH